MLIPVNTIDNEILFVRSTMEHSSTAIACFSGTAAWNHTVGLAPVENRYLGMSFVISFNSMDHISFENLLYNHSYQ